MKKFVFIASLGLLSSQTYASEGFTWLSAAAKVTGVEELFPHRRGGRYAERAGGAGDP